MKPTEAGFPSKLGYHFPAEWIKHRATWLSWPHNKKTWPGKFDKIPSQYALFVKEISENEQVCINICNEKMEKEARALLEACGTNLNKIQFYQHPTNDAWVRDHGPAFVIRNNAIDPKAIINWSFNAWGEKYAYELDNKIPEQIANVLHLPLFSPNVIMEGGSVDFNGTGSLITSASCLLNPNRNPSLSKKEIELQLMTFYGVEQVLWISGGILGDDTDGHVDDTTRFVSEDTVICAIAENKEDENYAILKENMSLLKKMRLPDNRPLNIIELPIPKRPICCEGKRLPASYANFYICNGKVIVPTYEDSNDERALQILSGLFPERKIVGLNSTDIVWGLGSWHCLSQQEPEIM